MDFVASSQVLAALIERAAIIQAGHTFAAPILVGLVGAVAAFALLWRRYAAGPGR